MWHYKDEDFEIYGNRQQIKEQLNIFIIELDGSEVIVNVWDDRHWQVICREYNLSGDDSETSD